MAQGELIGIINSDDYYELNAVECMVNAMTEEKYQILYGAMRTWKDGEEESISISSHKFLRDRMIDHPSCFVTRAVYEDFGYFDSSLKQRLIFFNNFNCSICRQSIHHNILKFCIWLVQHAFKSPSNISDAGHYIWKCYKNLSKSKYYREIFW